MKLKPTGRAVLSFLKIERHRGTRGVLGIGPEQLTGGMRRPLTEIGQTEGEVWERVEETDRQTDSHGLTLAAISEGSSRPQRPTTNEELLRGPWGPLGKTIRNTEREEWIRRGVGVEHLSCYKLCCPQSPGHGQSRLLLTGLHHRWGN